MEPTAFADLLAQHQDLLYKVATLYCPDSDDRQDLLQEMRVQVWQSFPRYDRRVALSTWLYRVALNTAISFYRQTARRQARTVGLTAEALHMPEPSTSDQEGQLRRLEQFISELGELDKALMLLYLEAHPHAVIADILGISLSNVATKVGRIKEKLKHRFAATTSPSDGTR
ncbi:MAG: sigma-70 family RNA polymerase sigma factor [Hymenobacter sp.]|nr:MAG: sigma-70 family RNA polymerase sigma factor [Hymenobacter sp.]